MILQPIAFIVSSTVIVNDEQVDDLPSKNQALCAFCVTCIVLLCVNLLYSLCKLNHC